MHVDREHCKFSHSPCGFDQVQKKQERPVCARQPQTRPSAQRPSGPSEAARFSTGMYSPALLCPSGPCFSAHNVSCQFAAEEQHSFATADVLCPIKVLV